MIQSGADTGELTTDIVVRLIGAVLYGLVGAYVGRFTGSIVIGLTGADVVRLT